MGRRKHDSSVPTHNSHMLTDGPVLLSVSTVKIFIGANTTVAGNIGKLGLDQAASRALIFTLLLRVFATLSAI